MKKKIMILGLLLPLLVIGCSTSDEGSSGNVSSSSISESETSSEDSSGSQSSSSEGSVHVKSVSLDRTTLQIFNDDTEAMLVATIFPEDATNKEITWTSSNASVVSVDSEGRITPNNKGTATITAKTSDGNKTSSCTVTVKEAVTVPNHVLHGLFEYETTTWTDKQMVNNSYSTSEYMILGVRLYKYDEFKIHMIGDAWYGYSAIKTNASIDFNLFEQGPSDDNIIIRQTGIYDIYCDYNYDYNGRGHIYLDRVDDTPLPSYIPVDRVELNRSGLYMNVRDQQFDLVANVLPNNASNKNVYWTSSDTSIATVSSSGKVTANRNNNKGSTTITAKTEDGNKIATCIVYFTAQSVPDYYLTGTIGGYSRKSYTTFPAIPLSTKKYFFPDVELMAGDVIYVTAQNGARIRVNTSVYEYKVRENMTANIYLDMTKMKDYLTFEPRNK